MEYISKNEYNLGTKTVVEESVAETLAGLSNTLASSVGLGEEPSADLKDCSYIPDTSVEENGDDTNVRGSQCHHAPRLEIPNVEKPSTSLGSVDNKHDNEMEENALDEGALDNTDDFTTVGESRRTNHSLSHRAKRTKKTKRPSKLHEDNHDGGRDNESGVCKLNEDDGDKGDDYLSDLWMEPKRNMQNVIKKLINHKRENNTRGSSKVRPNKRAQSYHSNSNEKRHSLFNTNTKEDDLTESYYNLAHFIDINFLKADNIPDSVRASSPLARSNLRPKEVSLLRISGEPNLRHWYINYKDTHGSPSVLENLQISRTVHGMNWKTQDGKALDFKMFFVHLTKAAFPGKLYTMSPLVFYYLTEICKFKNVVKLDRREIQFDSYVCECAHHAPISHNQRSCTANRVWALRHCFSKEISSLF